MRDGVSGENPKILRREILPIADLDRVAKARRQRPKEIIKPGEVIRASLKTLKLGVGSRP